MKPKGLLFGVGLDDSDYPVRPMINGREVKCRYYMTWRNMLERCYCKKYQTKNPTYKGCTVAPEWQFFMNFRTWMMKQDWKGKAIDKDILYPGNKIYSRKTCIFVTTAINSLITVKVATRGKYPTGVSFNKEKQKFVATISEYGKSRVIGKYGNPEDAEDAYKIEKSAHIRAVAETQTNFRLKKALINRAEIMLNNLRPLSPNPI